jgi:predicted DNA-binding transcriptional regulator AlpA
MDRLLPLRALSRLIAVEEATILAWVEQGQFPAPVTLPNGEPRWRSSAVTAWQALLGIRQQREPVDLKNLPELAQEILQVLEEAEEEWLTAADVAIRIGDDCDHTSGSWKRATRQLRETGLIETNRAAGMRLGPRWGQGGASELAPEVAQEWPQSGPSVAP